MKTVSETNGQFSNFFLTGAILMAQLDYSGLIDYGVKALLGGAIWLGYKLTADYIDHKRKEKTNRHHEPKQ